MSLPDSEDSSHTCQHEINVTNIVSRLTFSRFLPAAQQHVQLNNYSDNYSQSESASLVECTVELEHSDYTDIESVGLQIWNGAFLLSEFVIHCGNSILHNKNVLDLASGTGLVGLIAGMYCSHITCTDIDDEKILRTIRLNFLKNQHLINASVTIQPFDFYKEWSTASDIHAIVLSADVVLVSEVVYENRLTDAFIEQLVRILNTNPKICVYIAIEKRYIFSATTLRVEAKHYEYFFERIRAKRRIFKLGWQVKRMKIDFPRYFNYYPRNEHLQLWRISKNLCKQRTKSVRT